MQAADDLVMLKRLVRAQARRHGVTACFMAKPIEKYAGSGMHLHVSLQDGTGGNVFSEAGGENWSPDLAARARRARRRPWPNRCWCSPRTPIPGGASCRNSYAPIAPTWGVNNRSVALRVPAGDAANRRIEHRPSGVDANPYLVAATVLAGIAKGLRRKARSRPGNHRQRLRGGSGRRARSNAGRLALGDRGGEGIGFPARRRSATTCTDLHGDQAGRVSARRAHGERTRLPPLSARSVSARVRRVRQPPMSNVIAHCAEKNVS